jgi:bifunctional ADP-heptose synthase (sugar kinase/adenylyltransferase)
MTPERLNALLGAFPRLTIGLVGDLFLDRYLHLARGVHELSIETGEEAYQIDRVRNSPGALGTVMNNLAALGVGLLVPVTVIGDDGHGYDLLREVGRLPVDKSNILCYTDRLTPTYTKPMRPQADGSWRELNRLDVRTRGPLSEVATADVCQRVRDVFRSSDGLIVLDQINESNWGVVNAAVRETIEQLGRENPHKLIFVDSRAHLERFTSCTLKGNRNELTRAAQELKLTGEALADLALELAKRNQRNVYVTQGESGIFVARPSGSTAIAHGIPVAGPIDIVGAGDSATGGIVTSLLAGATDEEAALVGNLVASITIEQLGTTGTASPQQVRERLAKIV